MKKILLVAAVAGLIGTLQAQTAMAPKSDATQEVKLNFAAEINGASFECGKTYPAVGTTQSTLTPSDFRMYVSEVQLIDAAGRYVPVQLKQDGTWQRGNLALLDFENGTGPCKNGNSATHMSVEGHVPKGQYTGVRFELGVPFSDNHQDPTVAPAPLNMTAMFWTWQGGYKFLKFDAMSSGMKVAMAAPAQHTGSAPAHGAATGHGATPAATGFSVHLGSTMCTAASRTSAPSACMNGNRVAVEFKSFDLARHTVVADIGKVLAKANVDVNATGTSPGCMSFPKDADCPPVMSAFGLAYDGQAATGTQQFFSAR